MADQIYNVALLGALIAGGSGAFSWIYSAVRRASGRTVPASVRRSSWISGWTALVLGTVSVWVHAVFGHGPGSMEPLGARGFLRIHPIYFAVVGLVLASFAAYRLTPASGDSVTGDDP